MISAFYTAAAGVNSNQDGLDITANNIANLSTGGFKADKASFSDLIYSNIRDNEGVDSKLKAGHGSKVAKSDTLFTQGPLTQTDRSLDYALTQENAFFALRGMDGSIKYTRCGSFQLSERGGRYYLADAKGAEVLGTDGQPIVVTDQNQKQNVAVFSFPYEGGLMKSGDNYYVPTQDSGAAAQVRDPEVKQGFLEESTVNMASEMSDMISLSRAFDFNAKMVKMSDEIMQTINSLR